MPSLEFLRQRAAFALAALFFAFQLSSFRFRRVSFSQFFFFFILVLSSFAAFVSMLRSAIWGVLCCQSAVRDYFLRAILSLSMPG